MKEFTEGDIVQLKSGGPKMTVKTISSIGSNKPELFCQWFSGSKLNTGRFSFESIIKVSEEKEKNDGK